MKVEVEMKMKMKTKIYILREVDERCDDGSSVIAKRISEFDSKENRISPH
jgi:hypothetical protein